MLKEYHKIETLFERDAATKKLIIGKYRNPTVEFLKDAVWQFTEKVDGTNIRVHWDGHKVSFAGRTDRAQIPSHLLSMLEKMFGGEVNEQIFEQTFGEKEVTLYGEGYGHKIQTNGYLNPGEVKFILFDVFVGDVPLKREDIEEIAKNFGIIAVPLLFEGTLQEGIDTLRYHYRSYISDLTIDGGRAYMEGFVARPKVEMRDRFGNRIIVKLKYNDFYGK